MHTSEVQRNSQEIVRRASTEEELTNQEKQLWNNLPDEVIVRIFKNLKLLDLISCSLVNHRFLRIALGFGLYSSNSFFKDNFCLILSSQEMSALVKKNRFVSTLTFHSLEHNGMTSQMMGILNHGLPAVIELSFKGSLFTCCFPNLDSSHLVAFAKIHPKLKRMDVSSYSNLSRRGFERILSILEDLRELVFKSPDVISNASLELLANRHTNLCRLSILRTSSLDSEDRFAKLGKGGQSLREIFVTGDAKSTALIRLFDSPKPLLERIVLNAGNKFEESHIALIARMCPKLAYLDLSSSTRLSKKSKKSLEKFCPQLKSDNCKILSEELKPKKANRPSEEPRPCVCL